MVEPPARAATFILEVPSRQSIARNSSVCNDRAQTRHVKIGSAGCERKAYRMIGNGVSVPVGEWIGSEIRRYFGRSRDSANR